MKRIVSYLLAAVLVLGPCMSSYATEPDRTQESTEPAKGQETENVGGEASSTGGEQQSTETQQDTDMQQDADKEQDADVQQDVDKEQDAGTLPVSGEEDTDENADESRQTEEASKDKGQVDVYIAQTLEYRIPGRQREEDHSGVGRRRRGTKGSHVRRPGGGYI